MKKLIKSLINRLPYISSIYEENQLYRKNACYAPGHYYSPIVSVEDIEGRRNSIWSKNNDKIHSIDLRSTDQISLLETFEKYYNELPFKAEKQVNLRYYFKNNYYSYTDGIILYSFIRHFKPKRIIEAGSGFSSALMLDTNELFFNNSISLSFIEPYLDRLKALFGESDHFFCEIIEKQIQELPVEFFSSLEKGDILFIDSSHVSKTGSDVNFLFFHVFPILKPGVIIHFHDIFFPFEYPEEWVIGGRNWNEIYLLRSFLMNNNDYKILFFSHYIHLKHQEAYKNMPLIYNDWGCNFWMEKISQDKV